MRRLSWQWVNRLLVLIALLLPLVYVFIYALNIRGANLGRNDFVGAFDSFALGNPLAYIPVAIIEEGMPRGFQPINDFISWLSEFFGDVAYESGDFPSVWLNTFLGYVWWVFHVLLFDVLINGVTFFFRFIKKLMYMFEKEDK